ncbi:MAG TPA: hypothetical protein VFR73_16160 [Hyphomicrobiaceae bacterium]|nr:hypothetical protein [Hyphomicrobiaceae bacterium]
MQRLWGGVSLTVVAIAAVCQTGPAQAQESAKDIIAAHIRMQGYACEKPISAERDQSLSRPDEAVWLLKCENHSYQVRLIPDMAAKVSPLN